MNLRLHQYVLSLHMQCFRFLHQYKWYTFATPHDDNRSFALKSADYCSVGCLIWKMSSILLYPPWDMYWEALCGKVLARDIFGDDSSIMYGNWVCEEIDCAVSRGNVEILKRDYCYNQWSKPRAVLRYSITLSPTHDAPVSSKFWESSYIPDSFRKHWGA